MTDKKLESIDSGSVVGKSIVTGALVGGAVAGLSTKKTNYKSLLVAKAAVVGSVLYVGSKVAKVMSKAWGARSKR